MKNNISTANLWVRIDYKLNSDNLSLRKLNFAPQCPIFLKYSEL